MKNLNTITNLLRTTSKNHSSLIFSVMAGVGTLMTAYLSGRASIKAYQQIDEWEELHGVDDDVRVRIMERVKVGWKYYIPTVICGAGTVACIAGSHRIGVQKTIAAQTALAVSQEAYSEYRNRVVEHFGDRKDQTIRAEIAEDKIKKNPPPPNEVLMIGPGNTLCCEMYTGRYFSSDMEKLRKSVNDLNEKLLTHDYQTLNDFYYMVGLGQTSPSGQLGWTSDKLLKVDYSSILTDDGRPCLAFDYNYVVSL
jgi:hypothetical protein